MLGNEVKLIKMNKIYNITFTKEEKDAVLPQIACRLDELESLMVKAGEQKNTKRVLELATFINHIREFYNKLMMA